MSILRISEFIECRHVTSILVCLFLRPVMTKSQLYQYVSTNPRMSQKLDMLRDMGLVTYENEGRRTLVRLTGSGMAVAEGLCEIERRLYGAVDDPGHVRDGNLDIEGFGAEETDRFIPRVDSFHGPIRRVGRGQSGPRSHSISRTSCCR